MAFGVNRAHRVSIMLRGGLHDVQESGLQALDRIGFIIGDRLKVGRVMDRRLHDVPRLRKRGFGLNGELQTVVPWPTPAAQIESPVWA